MKNYTQHKDKFLLTLALFFSTFLCFSQTTQTFTSSGTFTMTSTGSWNMWFRSEMVVAMSPQHAGLCAKAGMSRADVHQRLCELAVREQRSLKRGGNWRPERAVAMGADPDDDDCLIKAVKDPQALNLIVAGGMGPVTAVCHGWNDSSRAVHGKYETT